MTSVLITGIGLISKHLAQMLEANGFQVSFLSRSGRPFKDYKVYKWNPSKGEIDIEVLKNCNIIIHLAGASISKRWTNKYQKEILNSRTQSTKLLVDTLNSTKHNVHTFIGGSAIGYYGAITKEITFTEEDSAHNDFLGKVCLQWEQASQHLKPDIRRVVLRIGVVFSRDGGAFIPIINPIKKGIGTILGSGKQYIPWIHIKDICAILIHLITNESLNGIYNGVSPNSITNSELTHRIAKRLNKTIWLPNVPTFLLKLILGKMAVLALEGTKISCTKIEAKGYKFQYPTIESALDELI